MSVAKGSQPLVKLSDVGVSYGPRSVLDNIDISIEKGRILTLIGPNGAGKTTLVKALLGLTKITQGKVERSPDLRIGYMPQKLYTDITMPLTVRRFLSLSGAGAAQCQQALSRVGIENLLDNPVQGLSGGEMQRTLLARALLRKPNFLVLDEPVQGVDLAGQEALYQLIGQLRNELGCGILMVSHDLHLVMAATDEVICLNKHVCCHGSPQAVTSNPAYLQLFGDKTAFYNHVHDHDHDLHGEVVSAHRCESGSVIQAEGEGDNNA